MRPFIPSVILTLAAGGFGAMAGVQIDPQNVTLRPGETCTFTVVDSSGRKPDCSWVALGGGSMAAGTGFQREFTAPAELKAKTEVIIVAYETDHPAVYFTKAWINPRMAAWEPRSSSFMDRGGSVPVEIVGRLGSRAFRDGKGEAARLGGPSGIIHLGKHENPALDGKWAVADSVNNAIRLLDLKTRSVTTWLGPKPTDGTCGSEGMVDGKEGDARFRRPAAFAIDPGGRDGAGWRLLFTDWENGAVRSSDRDGNVTTLTLDPDRSTRLSEPTGLAVDPEGSVYICESGRGRVVKLVNNRVIPIAGSAHGEPQDGKGAAAVFLYLQGMARDPRTGFLYVVDGNSVRQVDPLTGIVKIVLGDPIKSGSNPGFPVSKGPGAFRYANRPCLLNPMGLTYHNGKLFVADRGNYALRAWDIDKDFLTTTAQDAYAKQIAFDPEGQCLMTVEDTLAFLTLPGERIPFASDAVAPEGQIERKKEGTGKDS